MALNTTYRIFFFKLLDYLFCPYTKIYQKRKRSPCSLNKLPLTSFVVTMATKFDMTMTSICSLVKLLQSFTKSLTSTYNYQCCCKRMPKTDENFELVKEWNSTVYANFIDVEKKPSIASTGKNKGPSCDTMD